MSREIITQAPATIASVVDGGYPSPTTVERHWSDGTQDFVCAAKACTFSAEGDAALRMISGHYRMAHTRESERHFPDVPFREVRFRRAGRKVTAIANTASNAEIVRAIRLLVSTAGDADETELAEFKSLLAMAEAEREAALAAQAVAERALIACKAELRELQTWRASFRSFVNGNGNTPH